jgi:hypothetical protein
LEFSRTRAHYLVFKEQVSLVNIVSTFSPLSSSLFFVRGFVPLPSAPPRAASVYVTNPRFPVKHLFEKSGHRLVASFRFWVLGFWFLVFGGTGVSPVHLTSSPHPKAAASTIFPVCRTPSGLAAHLQVSDPKSMAGNSCPRPRCLKNE